MFAGIEYAEEASSSRDRAKEAIVDVEESRMWSESK